MTGNWRRLGDYVISRRTELGYDSQDALAVAAGVVMKTVGRLERADSVSKATLGKIERALNWLPGSARLILAGGEPVVIGQEPEPSDPAYEALLEAVAVYIDEYGEEGALKKLREDARMITPSKHDRDAREETA